MRLHNLIPPCMPALRRGTPNVRPAWRRGADSPLLRDGGGA
jgi:hypothetical protein